MDRKLARLLRKYKATRDPEDAVNAINELLRIESVDVEYLEEPIPFFELSTMLRENDGRVSGVIQLDLHNDLDYNPNDLREVAKNRLVGEDYSYDFADIEWQVVDVDEDGNIYLHIDGWFE